MEQPAKPNVPKILDTTKMSIASSAEAVRIWELRSKTLTP